MIKYNMRYRGAYEYDKFALNVFQFYNETNMVIRKIKSNTKDSLEGLGDALDARIEALMEQQKEISILEEAVREV